MKPHFLFVFFVSSFAIGSDNRLVPIFPGETSFSTPFGTPPNTTPTLSRKNSMYDYTSTCCLSMAALLHGLPYGSLKEVPRSGQTSVQETLDPRGLQQGTEQGTSDFQKPANNVENTIEYADDSVGPEFPGTNWTTPSMPRKTDVGQDSQEYRNGCLTAFPLK